MENIEDTEYQDEQSQELDDGGLAIELAVLSLIAKALGGIKPSTTYADARLSVSKAMPKIERYLSKGGDMLAASAGSIIERMADANDDWAAEFYERQGIEQRRRKDNARLSAIVDEAKESAAKAATSLCNASIVGMVDETRGFQPIRDAFTTAITDAVTAMQAGKETYQQAIERTVDKLAMNGLRVQYASGRTLDLHTAVRTNVMDGYRDAMVKLREVQGQEYGADGVEVSAHSNCAPDHQDIQGRQYTKAEFERVNARLDRPIGGVNCRHSTYPVLIGISSKKYTAKDRADLKKRSNQKVTIVGLDGKERTMTRYEATQYQRRLETMIRKQRARQLIASDVTGAQSVESAKATASKAKANVSRLTKEYRRISEEAGLATRMERTNVYTLD